MAGLLRVGISTNRVKYLQKPLYFPWRSSFAARFAGLPIVGWRVDYFCLDSEFLRFRRFFRGARNIVVEYIDPEEEHLHEELKAVEMGESPTRLRHYCWCQPVLVYEDPEDNCQVWVHNRVQ